MILMKFLAPPIDLDFSLEGFYSMLEKGEIKAGMVLIFRYQGPKGAPGMPEMLGESMLLAHT